MQDPRPRGLALLYPKGSSTTRSQQARGQELAVRKECCSRAPRYKTSRVPTMVDVDDEDITWVAFNERVWTSTSTIGPSSSARRRHRKESSAAAARAKAGAGVGAGVGAAPPGRWWQTWHGPCRAWQRRRRAAAVGRRRRATGGGWREAPRAPVGGDLLCAPASARAWPANAQVTFRQRQVYQRVLILTREGQPSLYRHNMHV